MGRDYEWEMSDEFQWRNEEMEEYNIYLDKIAFEEEEND